MARLKSFTLIESLAALTIVGFTLVSALQLFSGVVAGHSVLSTVRAEKELDGLMNEFIMSSDRESVFDESGLTFVLSKTTYADSPLTWVRAEIFDDKVLLLEKNHLILAAQ